MFYTTDTKQHGLPHDPFKAIVAPRPIGWVSTLSQNGVANLAPYSFFNAISLNPDLVMFSSMGWKDSATNARDTGEFVCNYASASLQEAMNQSSAELPEAVSEFEWAGLERADCQLVKPPRVARAYAALECKVAEILEPKGIDGKLSGCVMVLGQVVGVHLDEAVLRDGRFDVTLAKPITRLGYMDFGGPDGLFEMPRPTV